MGGTPIRAWFIVLTVVRHEGRYLLIQERKHAQRWFFPAGRVDPGEKLVRAAQRETREEAGIDVEIDGILRIEHTPRESISRLRVLFLAHPAPGTDPEDIGGEDSLAAAWVRVEDLDGLLLRGEEVRDIITWVDAGAPVYPTELITLEWMPYE